MYFCKLYKNGFYVKYLKYLNYVEYEIMWKLHKYVMDMKLCKICIFESNLYMHKFYIAYCITINNN